MRLFRHWHATKPAKHARKRLSHRPQGRRSQLPRILKRIYFAGFALVVVTFLGTFGFLAFGNDKTTFSDALYMTLISITTVGYAEVVPLPTIWGRIYAGLISFVGFGGVTFLFTSLSVFFMESDIDLTLRRNRMNKKIDRLENHFIVCGYGRVGQNIGTELADTGRPFVAIDADLQLLLGLADRDDQLIWRNGDATDDEQLIAAGIERAQGVFAVSDDDAKNMMITLSAKQLNPKVRVVARCHEIRSEEKLKKVGADQVVLPDFTGGLRIVTMMIRPQMQSFFEEMMRSEHNIRVEEVTVPEHFKPRRLEELHLGGPNFILMSIRAGHHWQFNPQGDFMLHPGHVLIAMTNPEGRIEFEQAIR
jgi:voltage-gated potassium channel